MNAGAHRIFLNEMGNTITMRVRKYPQEPAVHIYGSGPDSDLTHRWTTSEAQALRDMLCDVLGASA